MKRKGYLYTIIIISVAITIAGSIYLGTRKNFVNDKDVEEKEPTNNTGVENNEPNDIKDEKKELSYDEITELLNIIDELRIVDINNKNLNMKDLPNELMFSFALGKLNDQSSDENNKIPYSKLNDIVNRYFGVDLVPEDYYCFSGEEFPYIKYDEQTKAYYYNDEHLGHGGNDRVEIFNIYNTSYVKDNVYTIEVKKTFSNPYGAGELPTKYYKSYSESWNDYTKQDKNVEPLFTINLDSDNPEENLNNFDKYLKMGDNKSKEFNDKLNIYTYTFEKIDANFVLKTYSIG